MKTKSFVKLIMTSSLLIGFTALAQVSASSETASNSATSVTQIKPENTVATKKFGLITLIEYSQKIAEDERASRESETSILFSPSIQLTEILKISAKSIFTQENYGPRNSTLSNTTISLGVKGFQLTEKLNSVHALNAVAPTNQLSQKTDRLKTSVSITNGLSYNHEYFKLNYKLALARNFHEYTVNAEGSPNIEYNLSNSLELIVPITDKFSVSVVGNYKNGKTYKNFDRSSFALDADLNYDFTPTLSLNIGTSNEGSAFKANGVDSNIQAYNENTSVNRLGLSYTY